MENNTAYIQRVGPPGTTLERQLEYLLPSRLPVPGDTLVVEKPFVTRAGLTYWTGYELKLKGRTKNAPYGFLSSVGNWQVKCPYRDSIWSNIEMMIAQGELSYKDEPNVDSILTLAAIIRKVNGNNRLGAAALAEAILEHPDFCKITQLSENENRN